ncbi:hypothetical protein EVAR_10281_1 [Eumeta japonica]|uniref:DUF4371 domain-containing protein n=1 Tax=Eumeta variegata TaxID=151549 RepID=A0A4C1TEV2_EUMVA|nr:hypothetical protein EVAR_10281_1 [Eumeta japonica]
MPKPQYTQKFRDGWLHDLGLKAWLHVVESTGGPVPKYIPMLYECDADGIVAAIKASLTRFGIPLQNLMGIGTDNAAVMVGVNNGVHAKLKRELQSLILVRCVFHSLQLAISAATK